MPDVRGKVQTAAEKAKEGAVVATKAIAENPGHATIGAVIGTVLIPVPVVGTVIGAYVGGWIGHKNK